MLKKVNRLAKDKDIQMAFSRGRTFFNQYFTVKFVLLPQSKRFTVVVSTKVYKNAVARNRLKRLLREYIRKNLPLFRNGGYVIMAKPKVKNIPESLMLKSFVDVCSRLNHQR